MSSPAESRSPEPALLLPSSLSDTPVEDPLFDEFWAAYPRRVGKGAARRAWRMAQRNGADPRLIIAAAGRFRDDRLACGTEQKFIPHPSSWLGREHYADEVPGPEAAPSLPAKVPDRLNDEQLLAVVVRLAGDQERPVTMAAEIIRAIRAQLTPADLDAFPVVSLERGRELAAMPYPDYLQTPEWQERRKIILKRAGYRCQVCNRDRSLHVHHRTYERRGVELPSDLTALCDDCHALYHDKGLLAAQTDVA